MKRVYHSIAVAIRGPVLGRAIKLAFSKSNMFVYKATKGRVWNTLRGGDLVLLTTRGRKTGKLRTWPLLSVRADDRWIIIGSNAGGPTHPAWVHNLRANPVATLTVKDRAQTVRAHEITDEREWERLFARFVAAHEDYADYTKNTDRKLPIFKLEPATGGPDGAR